MTTLAFNKIIKTQKATSSNVAFIAKLRLLSYLVLAYLLFNEICSIASVLRVLHIPLEIGLQLDIHKFYKHSF